MATLYIFITFENILTYNKCLKTFINKQTNKCMKHIFDKDWKGLKKGSGFLLKVKIANSTFTLQPSITYALDINVLSIVIITSFKKK